MRRRDFIVAANGAALSLAFAGLARGGSGMAEVITHDIVVTRLFDASPERVWRAWTEDAEVMKWWGPDYFTSPAAKMDVREGSRSLVCMRSPDGTDMWMTWDYTRVIPFERLEYVQNISDAAGNLLDPAALNLPPEFPRDVATVVTLAAKGDKTETTITETTRTTQMMLDLSRQGLEQCLDKMGRTFA